MQTPCDIYTVYTYMHFSSVDAAIDVAINKQTGSLPHNTTIQQVYIELT